MSLIQRMIAKLIPALCVVGFLMADDRWAPHAVAGPVNQLEIAGNACGPAALLASFRCGDERWRKVSSTIPGTSDKSKLLYIIRAHGLKPSASLSDRKRWTKSGINSEDLSAVAGELAAIGGRPAPRTESLLRTSRESPEKLLRRTHKRLRNSLKEGFPPVLSLRRYVLREGNWQTVQGHFVTVVRVPDKLDRKANSFTFTYFDPWGGMKQSGTLRISTIGILADASGTSACLIADAPKARVGKSKVRSNESSEIIPALVIGHW